MSLYDKENEDGSITFDWQIEEHQIGVGVIYHLYSDTFTNGVEESDPSAMPSRLTLLPAYPNPFNASINIRFDLRNREQVQVTLFNVLGQEVATLLNKSLQPGSHSLPVDASKLASGVYFYRIETNKFIRSKKMLLLK